MSSLPPFSPAQQRLRRLHRWLGVGSLAFVLLLSFTGIALNHSSDMALDQRYVKAAWLLDWYGIETPPVEASFAVGDHRATLLGERLYFDGREIADAVSRLAGAVFMQQFVAVPAASEVFVLTTSGELVERINVAAALPAGIDGIGSARGALILRSGKALFYADESFSGFTPCVDVREADVKWSLASEAAPSELDVLQALHRGRGVSVERLLADLHSGRLFSRLGPLVMDLVGAILIVLSLFGVMMWMRGNGRRR